MLQAGSKAIELDEEALVTIRSDGPFVVYQVYDGEKTAILGPARATDRVLVFRMADADAFAVEASDATLWSYHFEEVAQRSEVLDPKPMEIPLGHAPSMEDQVKTWIREELSAAAEAQQMETLEESLDFDVDEDPDLVSGYELPEMDSEFPLENQEDTGHTDVSRETEERKDDRSEGESNLERPEPAPGGRGGEANGDSEWAGSRSGASHTGRSDDEARASNLL